MRDVASKRQCRAFKWSKPMSMARSTRKTRHLHDPFNPGSLQLRTRLGKLPQEIYDSIQDMTFATPNAIVLVERSKDIQQENAPRCNPPLPLHLMHVSRSTSSKFSRAFFESTTFVFSEVDVCVDWTSKMPDRMLKGLRHIRCFEFDQAPSVNLSQLQCLALYDVDWRTYQDMMKAIIGNRTSAAAEIEFTSKVSLGAPNSGMPVTVN
jgi:hypothetical protein